MTLDKSLLEGLDVKQRKGILCARKCVRNFSCVISFWSWLSIFWEEETQAQDTSALFWVPQQKAFCLARTEIVNAWFFVLFHFALLSLSCSFSLLQFRRHRFDPWIGKIHWWRAWQPTLVFLTGKSHGQRRVGHDWSTQAHLRASSPRLPHLGVEPLAIKPGLGFLLSANSFFSFL